MARRPTVEVIDIDGVINPAAADFINDSIARAWRLALNALVIELDTPGGLLSSAQTIVKAILNAPIAGDRLCHAGGRERRVGRNLHHRSGEYRGDGARHDDRRGPSGGS